MSATTGLYFSISQCPETENRRLMVSGRHHSPLFELWVLHPVWEALPANTDAFQDSVTSQLVHDQVGVHHACQKGGHRMPSGPSGGTGCSLPLQNAEHLCHQPLSPPITAQGAPQFSQDPKALLNVTSSWCPPSRNMIFALQSS